jgi:hypothetical protein
MIGTLSKMSFFRAENIYIDDTLNFAGTEGPLKIKDQAGRIAYKDVGSNKQHMKSLIVTLV